MADDVIRPVGRRHQPLREVVADEIKQAILSGRLRPGERLVEDRLADELGVSRNPVREALRMLAAEGLVDLVPRRGASVARFSEEEGHDLLEVRAPLEALAARLAARRITPEQVTELRAVLEDGLREAEAGRVERLPELNTRFHMGIVTAADNHFLAEVIRSLRDRIQWLYAADVRARAPESWQEHARILEAIAAGDEEQAAACAAEHIVNAERAFTGGQAVVDAASA